MGFKIANRYSKSWKSLLSGIYIYNYQACLEVLKLLKFHRPTLLYKKYSLSQRNNSTLLILPHKSKQFTFISSRIWNAAMKHVARDSSLADIKLGSFKRKLKTCLLKIQGKHDGIEWYPLNFKLDSLYTQWTSCHVN